MTYRIEPAAMTHLPWMRLLFARWVDEKPEPYPVIDDEEYDNFVVSFARQLHENPDLGAFVAIKGRRVIGFIVCEITTRAIGKPHRTGRVHWLYVIAKHRGHGAAARLIEAAFAWVEARGGVEAIEIIESSGLRGKKLTSRYGFQPFAVHYVLPMAQVREQAQRHLAALERRQTRATMNGGTHPHGVEIPV